MIPKGVHLTSYPGESTDLPADILQDVVDGVAAGNIDVPIAHVYHELASVGQDQSDLESNKYNGKHVVVL
ncbi:MDR/zinc-dependent alcohol dehydrogenase-like family protein [Companilactobacillus zhongbaensis]|uniref:hypothetical protein n=1 Tax=Companilactobacillus zhongbaensis TaxID=2486009 RepID=UPI000F77E267|nr:hypothetical protein [Companilactobacillus zhongbaensis]